MEPTTTEDDVTTTAESKTTTTEQKTTATTEKGTTTAAEDKTTVTTEAVTTASTATTTLNEATSVSTTQSSVTEGKATTSEGSTDGGTEAPVTDPDKPTTQQGTTVASPTNGVTTAPLGGSTRSTVCRTTPMPTTIPFTTIETTVATTVTTEGPETTKHASTEPAEGGSTVPIEFETLGPPPEDECGADDVTMGPLPGGGDDGGIANPLPITQPGDSTATAPTATRKCRTTQAPTSTPSQFTTTPADATTSAEETTDPAKPTTPAEASTAPAEDTTSAGFTTAPVEVTTPAEATTKPAELSTTPAEVTSPALATTTPVEVTTLAAATTDPVEVTSPAELSTVPAEVTTAPAEVTSPAVASTVPAEVTTVPVQATTPAQATSPAVASSVPAEITTVPVQVTSEPAETRATEVTVIEESPTTGGESTLIVTSGTTCKDCSYLNVQLFNGEPFDDAAPVLNRYSANDCYYVQFFCRPITIGDNRPVATILSGDLSDNRKDNPLNINLACRDGEWIILDGTNRKVTSLGCVYDVPATTTAKPTTKIPGVDPNNPCMNCSQLVASQSTYPEGVTYLDHTIGMCLSVKVYCLPTNTHSTVEFMFNNELTDITGPTLNRTFTCNAKSKWLDQPTGTIVKNISCIMIEDELSTTPMITMTPFETTELEVVTTKKATTKKATTTTKPIVSTTTPKTTPKTTRKTTRKTTSTKAPTTPNEPESTEPPVVNPTVPSNTEEPVESTIGPQEPTTTASGPPTGCAMCPIFQAQPLNNTGGPGLFYVWNDDDLDIMCNRVEITCEAMTPTDNAALSFSPIGVVMTGSSKQTITLTCQSDGNWKYNGVVITSATCVISKTVGPTPAPTSAPIPTTTVTTRKTTTVVNPEGCTKCTRMPVTSVTSSSYANGLTTAVLSVDDCTTLVITCQGSSETDDVAIFSGGKELISSVEEISMIFICSSTTEWVSEDDDIVDAISCGRRNCGNTCPTLNTWALADPTKSSPYDGFLVIYNYIDPVTKCKVVDISCQGTSTTENSTLIFDPIGPVLTSQSSQALTLKCDIDNLWKYQGSTFTRVGCLVSTSSPGSTMPPVVTTTLVPTTTTPYNHQIPPCMQCSRLEIQPEPTENGYANGHVTVDFFTDGSCSYLNVLTAITSRVLISLFFLKPNEPVALKSGNNYLVTSATGSASVNLSCSMTSSWIYGPGPLVVPSVSCSRQIEVIPITTTLLTTTTRTTTVTIPATTPPTTTPTKPPSTTSTTPAATCSTSCPNLEPVAKTPSEGYDGMIVLDHFEVVGCSHVGISCSATKGSQNATLLFENSVISTGASRQSVEAICDVSGEWIYDGEVVPSVSCIVTDPNVSPGVVTSTPPATTVAPSTIKDIGAASCSVCPTSTISSVGSSSSYQDGFVTLTNDFDAFGCRTQNVLCQGITSTEPVALLTSEGVSLVSGPGKVSLGLSCSSATSWVTSTNVAVTTLSCGRQLAMCSQCELLRPKALLRDDAYDGMIVLDNFYDVEGCLTVTVTCAAMRENENATLLFGENVVRTGASSQTISLDCNADAEWVYNLEAFQEVSCVVTNSDTLARKKRQAVTNPTVLSDAAPCAQCSPVKVTSVPDTGEYLNGFTTLMSTNVGGCRTTAVVCQGISPTDVVHVLVSGTERATNAFQINMTLACTAASTWQDSNGLAFPSMSCARKNPATTTTVATSTSTTTLATTTPTTSTTTLASSTSTGPNLCSSCTNLLPITPTDLAANEAQGYLVLDHYFDPSSTCRKVDITCSGQNTGETATIEFNDATRVISAAGQVSSSLTCSTSGQWIFDGSPTTGIACTAASSTSPTVTPAVPITTTVPPPTTTALGTPACLTCNRNLAQSVPFFYNSGFLILDTKIVNNCMQASLSCSAPDTTGEAVLVDSNGNEMASGTGKLNSTLTCDSNGQWITPTGSVVTGVSCGAPGKCADCSNVLPLSLTSSQLAPNQLDGELILDHYINQQSGCRVVDIQCSARNTGENATIMFNGQDANSESAAGQIFSSLTCTASGTWLLSETSVTRIACRIDASTSPTVAPPPITTTLAPAMTTPVGSLACANCKRQIVTPVSSIYNSGFLTMDTRIINDCLSTSLSCAAPTTTGTGVLADPSGAVLAQGTNLANLTLTCTENSQWLTPSGTVVTGVSCGTSGLCTACSNMLPILLDQAKLAANEMNGDLTITHYYDRGTGCRTVVMRCAGQNEAQDATIIYNNNADTTTLTVPGQVSIGLTCSAGGQWLRAGVPVTGIACKISFDTSPTLTPPPALTTVTPPPETTDPGTLACMACSRQLGASISSPAFATAFLTLDTETVNGCLVATLSCFSPTMTGTAVLLDSNGNQLATATGVANTTLTCSSSAQWQTATSTVVTGVSCGVAATTTPTPTTTPVTTPPTTTAVAGDPCAAATWQPWQEWSTCTDTCGACGTWQRFRACNKPNPSCLCSGTAFEKEPCNRSVCMYPRSNCCAGTTPKSSQGQFLCL
ncbi:unnamed protein product [Caenorhabditis auriculariae]|uniref:C6 domain-containing protein n=1 Tax=Caenorhabditis auriculariae TaxID=2777116 RepID=A0A8S1HH70_9PELO|nr:unnamed protein product [Caenorhabditis auriculariae]